MSVLNFHASTSGQTHEWNPVQVSHPDRDGDCKCPHSKQCFYEGTLGCPFSITATKNTYSPAYFSSQCMGCTCEAKIDTTTTTTTLALAIGAAKSRCPAFAALSTPDSEGDCSCYGLLARFILTCFDWHRYLSMRINTL